MIKPVFSVIDDAWKKEFSPNYILSILITSNQLYCSILDNRKNKHLIVQTFDLEKTVQYGHVNEKLKKIFEDNELFLLPYQSVSIAISNEKSTLVPDKLFDEKNSRTYLEFTNPVSGSEKISVDSLQLLPSKIIYPMDEELINFLQSQFENAEIHHSNFSLLQVILREQQQNVEKKIFAHIQLNKVEVIVMDKGEIIFFNHFFFQTAEDFIYYILFVCKQLNLDPDTIGFYFLGEVEKKSALFDITWKYIRNVNFVRRPDKVNYSYKFAFIPQHFYFNLFCIHLASQTKTVS